MAKKKDAKVSDLIDDLLAHYRLCGKEAFAENCLRRWELHLKPAFGHLWASQLTTTLARNYRTQRLAEGDSNTTVNRELQVLRRAFKLATRCSPPAISRDYVPYLEFATEDNARQGFLDDEQLARVRELADKRGPWMRAAVEIAYLLGWRRGEILSLRAGDINLKKRFVRLKTSKNGQPRQCPLNGALVKVLEPVLAGKEPTDRVFPQLPKFVYAWEQLQKEFGSRILFHDFRRTAARDKLRAGVPTTVIMALQGWKTEGMFRRYAITSHEDQLAAIEKVSSLESTL